MLGGRWFLVLGSAAGSGGWFLLLLPATGLPLPPELCCCCCAQKQGQQNVVFLPAAGEFHKCNRCRRAMHTVEIKVRLRAQKQKAATGCSPLDPSGCSPLEGNRLKRPGNLSAIEPQDRADQNDSRAKRILKKQLWAHAANTAHWQKQAEQKVHYYWRLSMGSVIKSF